MPWQPTRHRPRDHNVMLAVQFEDGRTAYLTVSPKAVEEGPLAMHEQVRSRQEKGDIPQGKIVTVKRVR
jgi:hypothetical protein